MGVGVKKMLKFLSALFLLCCLVNTVYCGSVADGDGCSPQCRGYLTCQTTKHYQSALSYCNYVQTVTGNYSYTGISFNVTQPCQMGQNQQISFSATGTFIQNQQQYKWRRGAVKDGKQINVDLTVNFSNQQEVVVVEGVSISQAGQACQQDDTLRTLIDIFSIVSKQAPCNPYGSYKCGS